MAYGLRITKAVATGNDFVIVDDLAGTLEDMAFNWSDIAREVCRRRYSVGADGLLILERAEGADLRMRIINPDGGEVEMCGNGARVSALYAAEKGLGDKLRILTGSGIVEAEVASGSVKLKMSDPKDVQLGKNLGVGRDMMTVQVLNTGVPHVVHMVEDIKLYPVEEMGRKLRMHTAFAPEGTNVNFVGPVENNTVSVRTYERGVEAETMACGTGSVASAVALGLMGLAESPVKVITSGGEELTVHFKITPLGVKGVFLQGPCRLVFNTEI